MAAPITQDSYLNDTSQFDYARKKAADQSAVSLQARKDALARRFASLGNLDSGAQIKQEENAANDEASNLTNANEGINAQQQAELGRRKEVVMGQQFASGEAEKGRTFQAGENALQRAYGTSEREAGQQFSGEQNAMQRKFATGERLSSQDFASIQAQLGRDFTTSERQALENYQTKATKTAMQFQRGETDKQMAAQKEQFLKTYGLSVEQFNAAKDQFAKTFTEETRINDANIRFAQSALDKKGIIEQLGSNLSVNKILNGSPGQAMTSGGFLGALLGGDPLGGAAAGGLVNQFSSWG